ncbi:MAG: Fic family protein [Candidatus Iainarchaeum sp.]|jgi:Fic family protein
MSRIIKRKVKGIEYFYLEESFKIKGKWVKESIYFGSEKPNNEELLKAFNELTKKCLKKGHEVLVLPLTEFVTQAQALKLKNAKENKKHLLKSMTSKQKEEFVRRERITFITESNAIEGSTLTYTATERIVEQEEHFKRLKKTEIITGTNREEQEAINLNDCLAEYDKLLEKKAPITDEMILRLHYMLLKKISGYEKYQGIYRPVQVYITGSMHEFPIPQEVPGLMKKLLDWYVENQNLVHPVELAAKFHTQFTTIHPFADGNGRMARLLMNYILQNKKYPFTNIPLKKRSSYMKTQAEGNQNNHKPFTNFLTKEIILQHTKNS